MAAPAEMKAGSCSFHNGLIAHGAGANMTPGWRRAMTCGFMPDGCTFNGIQNILTDEQFASYEIGDVLDDDRQNPLIHHRTKPIEKKLAERFADDQLADTYSNLTPGGTRTIVGSCQLIVRQVRPNPSAWFEAANGQANLPNDPRYALREGCIPDYVKGCIPDFWAMMAGAVALAGWPDL